jgi:hypothetical protein
MMFVIDVYSGSIISMYERYKRSDINEMTDNGLLIDYSTVQQAQSHALNPEASSVVKELSEFLESEILYRMSKWRSQATEFSARIFNALTGCDADVKVDIHRK